MPDLLAHAVSVPRSNEVTYRIQRPGGAVIGPLALADVLEMLATGRLSIDAAVSRSGGAFLPVPSMVELGRMLARPAYRFHEPIALHTNERWAVRLEHTPGLVFDITRRKRTGMLCARRGGEQVRLWFVDGAPVYSSSTDPRELLGSRLIAVDGLPRKQVDGAVERAWRTGEPLGRCLVDLGLCTAERIDAALREQAWRRLVALFRFRVGELSFVARRSSRRRPAALRSPSSFIASALLTAYSADEVANVLETVERGGHAAARVRKRASAGPAARRVRSARGHPRGRLVAPFDAGGGAQRDLRRAGSAPRRARGPRLGRPGLVAVMAQACWKS